MFKILDLFCGAGGFSSGLDSVDGFETIIGLDFDKYAIETFSKNFKNAVGLFGDITSKNIKDKIIALSKEKSVNMIVGGPPCQGFSLKGKNLGLLDERNYLFLEFLNIAFEIQPEIIIIENVKNMIQAANGYFIEQIKDKLFNEGYIVNFGIMNAKKYGVPQSRERAIIIASKSKSITLPIGFNKTVSVRDAISDLSYLESGKGLDETFYINKAKSVYQNERRVNSNILYNHKATNHSKIALEKLSFIPPEGDKRSLPKNMLGKQKFSTTWSRLRWDDVSPTIDTRFDTPSNGRNSHPNLNRAITPREAARLQSFDDNFKFYGNKTAICKQIGNAVPPLMARALAIQVKNAYLINREHVIDDFSKIYCSDAFIKIKEFQNEKLFVNHIITDPPYSISKENNFDTMKTSNRQGVDFGNWDKSFDLLSWIGEYSKILDKDGSFIIFCSYYFISDIVREMEANNIIVKDIIVWQKTNPMPRNINRRYVQDMEFAIWGVKKGAKWVFNKDINKPYMRSLISSSLVSGKERTTHPTQKSLTVMKEIIKIHTNRNDLILDPFMGSGTTGVASLELDRHFIGVEKEPDYFDISKIRLKKIINHKL